jgi:hypothetical protein
MQCRGAASNGMLVLCCHTPCTSMIAQFLSGEAGLDGVHKRLNQSVSSRQVTWHRQRHFCGFTDTPPETLRSCSAAWCPSAQLRCPSGHTSCTPNTRSKRIAAYLRDQMAVTWSLVHVLLNITYLP